jgi:hypothetical protein
MIKTGTWLPIFPGFYGTFFEANDGYVVEDIKEYFPDDFSNVEEFLYRSKEYDRAIDQYKEDVVERCCEVIEKWLKEVQVIKSLKKEKLVSPREYNFYNDSVNIEVTFTKKNVTTIKKIIKKYEKEWEEYILKRYTSYDGFISSHSNNFESDEWQINNAITNSHNCGVLLQFILLMEMDEDGLSELEFRLYEVMEVYLSVNMEALKEEYKEFKEEENK